MNTTSTTSKATDKQVKYLLDLIPDYYFGDPDKAKQVQAIVSTSDKLSKRDASTAITIMRAEYELQDAAWDMYHAGKCKASNHYAAHTDIYDDADDKKLQAIWDKL